MEKIRTDLSRIESMDTNKIIEYIKGGNVDVYKHKRQGMSDVDIYITKGYDHDFIYQQVIADLEQQSNQNNIIASVAIIPEGYENGDPFGVSHRRDLPPFERIRRITGYLVGSLDRFNDAKYSETQDRVKHGFNPKSQKCPDEQFREYVNKVRKEKGFSQIEWD